MRFADTASLRLLVVDVDAHVREAVAQVAATWEFACGGMDVRFGSIGQASTLEQGVQGLLTSPDVVVSEVRLGDHGAMAIVRVATRMREPPSVIAMSGTARPEEVFALSRQGLAAFVAKPFQSHEMRHAVQRVLSGSPPARLACALRRHTTYGPSPSLPLIQGYQRSHRWRSLS